MRPSGRPRETARCVRSPVEAGSIAYSAVIQPRPFPRSQRGTLLLDGRRAEHDRLALRVEHRAVRLLEEVRAGCRAGAARPAVRAVVLSCGRRLERRRPRRARPTSIGSWRKRAPISRKSSGSPVVRKRYVPSRASSFSIPLRASVSATSRAVSSAEKTSVTPRPKTRWKIGPDQRVVRAAEDDRVDPGVLERRRVLAHGLGRLLAERVVALDQRHEPRARRRRRPRRRRRARGRAPRSARSRRSPRSRAGRCAGSASRARRRAPRARARR